MNVNTLTGPLAFLSESQSVADLSSQLQTLLADHPEWPLLFESDAATQRLTLNPSWQGDRDEVQAFQEFALIVNNLALNLTALERNADAFKMIEASIHHADGPAALRACAEECCRIFNVQSLAGLTVQCGQLQRELAWDIGDPELPKLSFSDLHLVRMGEPDFRPTGVLLPLGGQFRARAAFWLPVPDHGWSRHDRALLKRIGQLIGREYERVHGLQHTRNLTALHLDILSGHPEQAYQLLLERALATIPGAECGSLLILEDNQFRYRAMVTFDKMELHEVSFSVELTRDQWYGLGDEAWHQGIPRVDSEAPLFEKAAGYEYRGEQFDDVLPSVASIRSSIGVPIPYQGEVRAFLNIDSLTDPNAFAEDSVALARSFGLQASLLLHEAHLRAEVQAAAQTDSLTGLLNRRAFTECLTREIAVARQQQQNLALLIADIRSFKAVNDTFGHAVGDEALKQVSQMLHETLRGSDVICRPGTDETLEAAGGQAGLPLPTSVLDLLAFRWGGDEFAILLPSTTLAGAQIVKERLKTTMTQTDVGGKAIQLNIGVAVLREDDHTGERLLWDADADMYREKKLQY